MTPFLAATLVLSSFVGPLAPHARGWAGDATIDGSSFREANPPVILVHPVGGAVPAGSPYTLSVVAQGAGPLSYQWFFQSVPIPGANGASHLIAQMQCANQGLYQVAVSDAGGVEWSNVASLTILFVQPVVVAPVAPTHLAASQFPATTFAVTVNDASLVHLVVLEPVGCSSGFASVPFTVSGNTVLFAGSAVPGNMRRSGALAHVRLGGACPDPFGYPGLVSGGMIVVDVGNTRISPEVVVEPGPPGWSASVVVTSFDFDVGMALVQSVVDGEFRPAIPNAAGTTYACLIPLSQPLVVGAHTVKIQRFSYSCQSSWTHAGFTNEVAFEVRAPELVFAQQDGAGSLEVVNLGGPRSGSAFSAVSFDPSNRSAPGAGWWQGLHIGLLDLGQEISYGAPPFLSTLDAAGNSRWAIPGGAIAPRYPFTQVFGVTSFFSAGYGALLGSTPVSSGLLRPAFTTSAHPTGFDGGNRHAAAADLDGDGLPDFACNSAIWRNDGGNVFKSAFAVDPPGIETAFADFDGDGVLDLVTTDSANNPYGSSVRTLITLGTSPAGWIPGGAVALPFGCWNEGQVAVADLNHDSRPDLVVSSGLAGPQTSVAGRLDVFLNQGGHPPSFAAALTDLSVRAVAIGDFDGDGHPDLVSDHLVGSILGASVLRIHWGDGTGTFSALHAEDVPVAPESGACFLAAADFDGNGVHEIVWSGLARKGVIVRLAGGNWAFRDAGPAHAAPGLLPQVATGDFDRDGDLDLASAVVTPYGSYVAFALNDGSLSFPDTLLVGVPVAAASCVIAADTDADGDTDLIVGGSPVCVLVNEN